MRQVSFNVLKRLPESATALTSLQSLSLSNNPPLGPPALVAALGEGQRATLREVLRLPDSHSLAYQAEVFKPKQNTRVRRLAGGGLAMDEAELASSDSEEEERLASRAAKPLKPRAVGESVLVYDHHGDLLDHATKQSYLCKSYTLHYQVERIKAANEPDADK